MTIFQQLTVRRTEFIEVKTRRAETVCVRGEFTALLVRASVIETLPQTVGSDDFPLEDAD